MSGPLELKVSAASVGAVLSGLVVWALQTYAFRGDVPLPVDAAVQVLIPAAVALGAGWLAKHTPRPDLQVDPVDVAAAEDEGRHVLDDDPDDIPVGRIIPPAAPKSLRRDGPV